MSYISKFIDILDYLLWAKYHFWADFWPGPDFGYTLCDKGPSYWFAFYIWDSKVYHGQLTFFFFAYVVLAFLGLVALAIIFYDRLKKRHKQNRNRKLH